MIILALLIGGCAFVFLHLTLPRRNADRFSGNYRARPGNFYWGTGRNRCKSMELSNNWQIMKSWILLTPFIIFMHGVKISTIS